MSNQVYISPDANQVNLINTDKQLVITEIGSGTAINVTQPITNVIEVTALGPQGIVGPQGPTGPAPDTNLFVTTASFNAFTGSYNTGSFTGSFIGNFAGVVTGSLVVTGSTQGNVAGLTISSNTASLDLSQSSFYTLQLVAGANTYINPSNIRPGVTTTLLVSTTGSATVSFPTSVKQPSGSAYIPTVTTGKDVLTFISYDTSALYLASVKNLV